MMSSNGLAARQAADVGKGDGTMDGLELVTAFCAAWDGPDLDRALAMLGDDIVYHNMPMAPLHGLPEVSAYLRAAGPFEQCRWDVLHIAAAGDHVLTERVDRMVVAGHAIVLPVMGIFRVSDGRIRAWRDYFDLANYRAQWPQAASGDAE
jgi:limonene-1,2-epoxide hydrolase